MTTPRDPELLERDRGVDSSSVHYPDVVRSVLLAPWVAAGSDAPDEATQLAARTVAALNEVARWANDGQAADPTACAWLAYLRWAVVNGAQPPADAPRPPADELDRGSPVLSAPGPHPGDSFRALATGRLGEVLRPVLPSAESPEVLARTAPYGLVPGVGWKSLVALSLDSAAITHGSPEAQTAATAMALAVHAAVRARESDAPLADVLAETARVTAEVTRPAPRTRELLSACADPDVHLLFRSSPDALAQTLGRGQTASEALALGLGALAAAETESKSKSDDDRATSPEQHADTLGLAVSPTTPTGDDVAGRALGLLSGAGVQSAAARDVVVVLTAARWGLATAVEDPSTAHGLSAPVPEEPLTPASHTRTAHPSEARTALVGSPVRDARTELLRLAEQWNALWRP